MFAVSAIVVNLDAGQGSSDFFAVGKPKMLKIHGVGQAPKGRLRFDRGSVTGSATFNLDSLDTGISLRNKHMKEKYLETSKFPKAELKLDHAPVPESFTAGTASSISDLGFKAKLTIHGVTREVEGKADIKRDGGNFTYAVDIPLKLKDWKIDEPGFSGITLADEITVKVNGTAPVGAAK